MTARTLQLLDHPTQTRWKSALEFGKLILPASMFSWPILSKQKMRTMFVSIMAGVTLAKSAARSSRTG
jgi:hypothetical protein